MTAKPKRKGQHTVRAVIRVYSQAGQDQLASLRYAEVTPLDTKHFDLNEVVWRPKPVKNEFNTESDWRRAVAAHMTGLYFDVLDIKYDWEPVE